MFRVIRAGAAIAIVGVLAIQLRRGLQREFDVFNFLSYFTVLSNLASASVLTALVIRPALIGSVKFAVVRGMATLWMVTTAVFFTAWIAPNLDDALRHVVSPLILLADWFLNPSPLVRPSRSSVIWLIAPGLYLSYILVRGPFVDWYPYVFLDPAQGGYWAVAGLVVIIMVVMAAGSILLASWPSYVAKLSISHSVLGDSLNTPQPRRLANNYPPNK